VVVAEGDEEGGAFALARKVRERAPDYDVRVTVLGHVQRGGSPSVNDRELASRLGVAAVEGLLDGRNGEMAGMVNNKVVFTPLQDAVKARKVLDEEALRVLSILSI
jgi:6-phosphofructokinase 1